MPSGAKVKSKSVNHTSHSNRDKVKTASNRSLQYHGTWDETRADVFKKANMLDTSSDDDDYQAGPRKSTAPGRVSMAPGGEVITSNMSLQEKMAEKQEKKARQSTFGKAMRKTKVWLQEAVTGEAVFSDEDWEEDLAREAALDKMKKKKVKNFRRDMIRKSQAIGMDRRETEDIIAQYAEKPLRLTAEEADAVEQETQRLLEESRDEREEEEAVRRETKAIEKANKLPNRFSLAFNALVKGSEKTGEDIIKHTHFVESVMSIKTSEPHIKFRKSIFPTQAMVETESEDEEEESDEYEEPSTVSTLTPEPELQQIIQIEDEQFSVVPQPPKEPSPRDHTPRPPQKYVHPSSVQKSPVVQHTKKQKKQGRTQKQQLRRHNRRNVSVEDLALQVAMSDDNELVECREASCQFPSLVNVHHHHAVEYSDDEVESLTRDFDEKSLIMPEKSTPVEMAKAPKCERIDVELVPWAEEVWHNHFSTTDLKSPQLFLDKQYNRHKVAHAIHAAVKVYQAASNFKLPADNSPHYTTQASSPGEHINITENPTQPPRRESTDTIALMEDSLKNPEESILESIDETSEALKTDQMPYDFKQTDNNLDGGSRLSLYR